eukprot:TRINITY_DN2119_c0_g2_i8.p2 TRINITY_DN2119_c0_g2~~TRINITY_DN2119_c0_g2_i8.p2  ORF type:complete len:218 (-),score=-11.68 TRINITY_DN2119_c0_g2_i8:414-1067(-)
MEQYNEYQTKSKYYMFVNPTKITKKIMIYIYIINKFLYMQKEYYMFIYLIKITKIIIKRLQRLYVYTPIFFQVYFHQFCQIYYKTQYILKKTHFRCYYQEVVICKHMVLMILHLITLFLPFKFRENERFYGQNSSEKKQKPQFLKNSFYNQLHQFVKFERCVQINGVLTNERSFFNFTFLNQKEKYKFLYLYKVGLIEAAEKCTYLKQQFWGKIYKF